MRLRGNAIIFGHGSTLMRCTANAKAMQDAANMNDNVRYVVILSISPACPFSLVPDKLPVGLQLNSFDA